MPIQQITPEDVVQQCAVCSATNRIPLHKTMAGALAGVQADDRVMPMPACRCGAVEFLIRSTGDERALFGPGTSTHLHRLLVDHLHDVVAQRDVPPQGTSAATKLQGGAPVAALVSPAELARWFPAGLTMPESLVAPTHPRKESPS